MDYELYRACRGDLQAVRRLWKRNKEILTARVFNPFGIMPKIELERRAVLFMLSKLELMQAKIQKRKAK